MSVLCDNFQNYTNIVINYHKKQTFGKKIIISWNYVTIYQLYYAASNMERCMLKIVSPS